MSNDVYVNDCVVTSYLDEDDPDYEQGTVLEIAQDGRMARVGWESGVQTWIETSHLEVLS